MTIRASEIWTCDPQPALIAGVSGMPVIHAPQTEISAESIRVALQQRQ